MVNKNLIEKTLSMVIKCSIRSRINNLTIYERRTLLDGKLNSREIKDYDMLMELYEELDERLSDETNIWRKSNEKLMALIQNRLYHYDKRIFKDYVVSMPKEIEVDTDRFETCSFSSDDNIETLQIKAQQDNVKFTSKEIGDVDNYVNNGFLYINGSIFNGHFWNNLNDSEKMEWRSKLPSIKQGLDNAISKTTGLTQDTVLFHKGYWDISLEEGDKFKWDTYTSFSYSENVARRFNRGKHVRSDADSWLVVGYAPTGMRGLAIEDPVFSSIEGEHEYLTGRGQSGTVYKYDEKEHIVYVLLDKS